MSVELRLETLAGGAVLEATQDVLQQVFDNIQDPNTKADGVREVNIKLKFKPGGERTNTALTWGVTSKLQPVAPSVVPVYVAWDHKTKKATGLELVAPDERPDQNRLPGMDKVTPIKPEQDEVKHG